MQSIDGFARSPTGQLSVLLVHQANEKQKKKGTGPHGPSHDQKDGSHEVEFGNPTGGPPALVAGTQKGIFFGFGRMMLLKKIHEGQSLRSAAEFLGMSYRAAWSKIKDTEKVLGVALIEKTVGRRAGYRLTEDGLTLMTCFKHWFTYSNGMPSAGPGGFCRAPHRLQGNPCELSCRSAGRSRADGLPSVARHPLRIRPL